MKLNKLFLLLLALPLAFAACETTPDAPDTPAADPVLTLTSEKSLQYTPEGGNGVITYTLENAVAGTELTATTSAPLALLLASYAIALTVVVALIVNGAVY